MMIKKITGYLLYSILKHIDLRLLIPSLGGVIEGFRQSSLKLIGANIGENSYIRSGAKLCFPQNLQMGSNSKINNNASLYLFDKLKIGNDVEIGPEFLVFTGEHVISDPHQPLTKQGSYNQEITIEDDVYIGARVTILKGAHIESRVVIAAGAVVTGCLKSGYIYGGVPAKSIKKIPS